MLIFFTHFFFISQGLVFVTLHFPLNNYMHSSLLNASQWYAFAENKHVLAYF